MNLKKCANYLVGFFSILVFSHCKNEAGKPNSSVEIIDSVEQNKLFSKLINLCESNVNNAVRDDSLAFLVLPVRATCPYCRRKTIDSISARLNKIPANRVVIISAKGGYKLINSYFKEQERELPKNAAQIVLDSNDIAYKEGLYGDKPIMYYAFNRKVYKKVESVSSTIKDDLHNFFFFSNTESRDLTKREIFEK